MKRRTLIQLVIALIILIGMIAAYAFWYLAVRDMSAKAAQLAADLRAQDEASARAGAAKAALGSLVADEEVMRAYLVRPDGIVPFLSEIERSGTVLGSMVEVASVATETGTDRDRIALSLRITGSFDAVLRTLGTIEHGAYDSRITNVTLDTPASDPESQGRWTATASFVIGTQPTP